MRIDPLKRTMGEILEQEINVKLNINANLGGSAENKTNLMRKTKFELLPLEHYSATWN